MESQQKTRTVSAAERIFLDNALRFGPGHLISKAARNWTWGGYGVQSPTVYTTKRQAADACNRFLDVLIGAVS